MSARRVFKDMVGLRSTILCWPLIAILIALVLILVRVLSIGGPAIFSDEYAYAAWSSALLHGAQAPPPLAASIGDWLYLRVYGIVFAGVGSFLVKARILNAVISALGAGILVRTFQTAAPNSKPQLAVLLSIGFAAGLLGTYAAYFIPEAPYFALVCLWLYCATRYARGPTVLLALGTGVVGGMATMVKAHGILILPATLVMFGLIGLRVEQSWKRCFVNIVALVVGWFVCTTVISLVLGNGSGINPIGSFYSGLGLHTAETVGGDRGGVIVRLGLQHVATLVAIAGMPLLLCTWLGLVALLRPWRSDDDAGLLFPAFALSCMLIGMLVVTVIFTVSVAGSGPFETISRLHGRYYEHFAILAACFGIVGSRDALSRWPFGARAAVFGLFVVLLVITWQLLQAAKWQNPNDFAIAYALFAEPKGRLCALLLSGISAFLALASPKHAPPILACALLIWLGFDAVSMEKLRWPIQEQSAGRVAAMVAANEAGANPRASIEIVGPSATVPVYRAAFHLLNQRTGFALGSAAKTCGVEGRTPDWVITIDGERDPCAYPDRIRIGDASAARRLGPSTEGALAGTQARYSAKLVLTGQPAIATGGKVILVKVNVTNESQTIFGSSSQPHNVNLGAHGINAAGDVVINDLARGQLPQIAPGKTAEATILLPLKEVLGRRVELLPVEENVAWFDQWGSKPLVMGPFEACASLAIGKVCDASGKPLPEAVTVQ
jgi:hypothetical protein